MMQFLRDLELGIADEFVVDRGRERLILTNSSGGYLRRVKAADD